jgi:hypothetical protein
MSGVDEMALRSAQQAQAGEQSQIQSFGSSSTTYVGIVRSERDDLLDATDETDQRLAPPEDLFYQWLNYKQTLEAEDGVPAGRAHDRAYEEIDYEKRFDQYLTQSDEAQGAVEEYADRVMDGERIVFVCFCSDLRHCHRHAVVDAVADNVA